MAGVIVADDIDGDDLTFTLIEDIEDGGGVLGLNSDGTFNYAPGEFNGDVTFVVGVTDGMSPVQTATITITVTPVNDIPVALDDTATTDEDVALAGATAIDVLANDSDIDEGDTLVIVAGSAATQTVHSPQAQQSLAGQYRLLAAR